MWQKQMRDLQFVTIAVIPCQIETGCKSFDTIQSPRLSVIDRVRGDEERHCKDGWTQREARNQAESHSIDPRSRS